MLQPDPVLRDGDPDPAVAAGPHWWLGRAALAVAIVVVGLLLIRARLPLSPWSWLLWIGAGAVAGAIAGQARQMWLAWLATGIAYGLSVWFGLTNVPKDILLGLVAVGFAGTLPAAGFIIGAELRGRSGIRRPAAAIGLAVVMVVGYSAAIGVVGRTLWVASDTSEVCITPAARGWAYEAINYDRTDDANLRPDCPDQGTHAGSAVVSHGDTSIAGWYIPAANGIGPDGATLVIVPGAKSSKSEMLEYALPFHDRFNLVIMDMRGEGRSTGETSAGLWERSDVAAMVDWVARAKQPAWIGGVGVSLGGAALLGAAAEDEHILALVLDSMQATFEEATGTILETEWFQPTEPGVWGVRAVSLPLLHGDLSDADPINAITRLGKRPVLLLHSTDDRLDRIEYSAELNLQAGLDAGVPVQLVSCTDARHGELLLSEPCRTTWLEAADTFLDAAVTR